MFGIGMLVYAGLGATFDKNFENSTILAYGDKINSEDALSTVFTLESEEEITLGVSSKPTNALLVTQIKQEDGTLISEFGFREKYITSLGKLNAGNYLLTIVNGHTQSVTVYAIVSSEQIENQLELISLYANAVIAGILLLGFGIVIMISGGIFLVIRNRKKFLK